MFTVVFRLLSHCLTLCDPMDCSTPVSLSFTISWSLLKLTSIESVRPSNRLIFCCPLFLLPSVFPITRVFSNDSVLRISWPEYWSFSFSISSSNKYSGLISFRIDWFDLLAVQGVFSSTKTQESWVQHQDSRSLLQHHQKHQFFSAQPF